MVLFQDTRLPPVRAVPPQERLFRPISCWLSSRRMTARRMLRERTHSAFPGPWPLLPRSLY